MTVRKPPPLVIIWRRCQGTTQPSTIGNNPRLPGHPVATHVTPFDIADNAPSELEIEAAARRLWRNRAVSHTHLLAKHLHAWLREAYLAKDSI